MISQAEVIKVARAMLDQPLIGSQLRRKTKNEYQAVSLARIIVRYILKNERTDSQEGSRERTSNGKPCGTTITAALNPVSPPEM